MKVLHLRPSIALRHSNWNLLHLHFVKFLLSACKYSFHPAVSFSRLVLRSGTKPKRRQKRRQNSRQAAWHEPGQELANLLPHPATTFPQLPLPLRGLVVLLLQAFVLPAPAKHQQHQQLLLLLMQLMLMLLVLVAAGSCCCDLLSLLSCCCHCYCCCYCCCYCHCYCYSTATATATAPAPAAFAATVASSSTLVASTSHSTTPGTSWHILALFFYNFCHCCCH